MNIQNKRLLRKASYINGKWVTAEDRKTFAVKNPYDQSLITEATDLSRKEISSAIEHAQKALKEWQLKTAEERSVILKKWFQLQMDYIEDLATILTYEQGKPLAEAKGEIKYGAAYVEWFAEEAKRVYGDTIPGHQHDKRIIILKQPIGVVATITPWNFPNAMITRKVAPALAVGCTVVIKPSELTPLSALALAELADEAGIPPGVLNVVTSYDPVAVGEEFTSNPAIKKISFTGSTPVGKLLMKKSTDTLKKVSLELGGNAPFIVLNDADIDDAVSGAIAAKYRNAGQTCICANRIFVQEEVYDRFIKKFVSEAEKLNLGNGLNSNNQIGPLINEKAVKKVANLVQDAIDKGAQLKLGGTVSEKGGTFFNTTVLANINKTMDIMNQEIFGPVAPIIKFKTDDEVIELANNTEYGLASYFYGNNMKRVWKIAEALEYGMVGINTGLISTPVAPFGGIKESGIGREGSKYGIDDYLILKYICLGGI
ncbi:MAG: NAD-dependent succinate-semialdehyde dehydrogenase [Flavobacteriales bacterium]